MPFASVRITPETNPTSIQRVRSSGVSSRAPSAKKPPIAEPHTDTPDSPIDSPCLTADASPSNPQSVVGSPPQTIWDSRAAPVQPERLKRASGRGAVFAYSRAARW